MKSVYPQRGVKAYFDEDEVSFSVAAVLAKEGRVLPPSQGGQESRGGRGGGAWQADKRPWPSKMSMASWRNLGRVTTSCRYTSLPVIGFPRCLDMIMESLSKGISAPL